MSRVDAPVVCCDLDGVIWRGDEPIPGSADAVAALRAAGAARRVRLEQLEHAGRRRRRPSSRAFGVAGRARRRAHQRAGRGRAARRVDARAGRARARVRGPRRRRGARRDAGFAVVDTRSGRRGRRRLPPRLRLRRARPRVDARCATAPASSPPTSTRPTRCPAAIAARAPARSSPRSRPRRARTPEVAGKPEPPTVALVRARFGDHGRGGRRPAVDRRRARRRARLAVRARALGIGGHDPARRSRPAAAVRRRRPRRAGPVLPEPRRDRTRSAERGSLRIRRRSPRPTHATTRVAHAAAARLERVLEAGASSRRCPLPGPQRAGAGRPGPARPGAGQGCVDELVDESRSAATSCATSCARRCSARSSTLGIATKDDLAGSRPARQQATPAKATKSTSRSRRRSRRRRARKKAGQEAAKKSAKKAAKKAASKAAAS